MKKTACRINLVWLLRHTERRHLVPICRMERLIGSLVEAEDFVGLRFVSELRKSKFVDQPHGRR